MLADEVEVKTGPRSTAHWPIHFIRLNGWLRHSFALLIPLLDIDGIGQNWEDSNNLCTAEKELSTEFLEPAFFFHLKLEACTKHDVVVLISARLTCAWILGLCNWQENWQF